MQDAFTKKIQSITKQYFAKHSDVRLVTVVGTLGKTSAEIAVATMLDPKYKVWVEPKHPESHLEVCLQILGIKLPSKLGFWEKKSIIRAAKERLKRPTGANVIIQELPVWSPEDINIYNSYLFPDVTILTNLTPTAHESSWGDEDVASNYLSLTLNSKKVFINRDEINGGYEQYLANHSVATYGLNPGVDYLLYNSVFSDFSTTSGIFYSPYSPEGVPVNLNVASSSSAKPAVVAAAVGLDFGMTIEEVMAGMAEIRPIPGRMRRLDGVEDSILIDDTSSATAGTVVAAIQAVQDYDAPQRIVVCGGIGPLGKNTDQAYRDIGEVFHSLKTDWLVLVGENASTKIGPIAKNKGVRVREFNNSIDAGAFVHSVIQKGAIVLYSGSEDGVYLEEAIKIVLHSSSDVHKLARQDSHSMEIKRARFSKF